MASKMFDKSGFMEWLQNTFHGFENSMFRGTVENIIDYGLKNKNISKDQLAYFLSDTICEVEFLEAARFCPKDSLTDSTLELLLQKG